MTDQAAARVPPHSAEAEHAVLGLVLLDNAHLADVAPLLAAPDVWYFPAHARIWQAVLALVQAGQPADVLTVLLELERCGQAEQVGGLPYLNQLAASVLGTRARVYAEVVAQRAMARQALRQAQALADALLRGDDAPAAIDEAVAALVALQQGQRNSDEPKLVGTLLPEWMDALQDRAAGHSDAISTGLRSVDAILAGGPRRGELVTIGARPSMGKSALMLTLTRHVARQVPVLVCSLEDSDMMLISRMVASEGHVGLQHVRMPDKAPESMWAAVSEGCEALAQLPIYLDDSPGMRLADIERRAVQVKRRAGDLGMVMVDYLQLMEGDGETRAYELTAIARGLKRLAKRLGCVVVALSQLNREADKVSGPPRLDHLAESDGLLQASDIVGLLWRQHRVKPTPENKHTAQVEWAKNKQGATDTSHLYFDGAVQRIADLDTGYGGPQ